MFLHLFGLNTPPPPHRPHPRPHPPPPPPTPRPHVSPKNRKAGLLAPYWFWATPPPPCPQPPGLGCLVTEAQAHAGRVALKLPHCGLGKSDKFSNYPFLAAPFCGLRWTGGKRHQATSRSAGAVREQLPMFNKYLDLLPTLRF